MSEDKPELHTCPVCNEARWYWIRLTKKTIACPHCGVVIYAVKAITVKRKDVPVENPVWLKKCPQCDMNDMEIQIELDSFHRQIRFPLCKPCAEELRKCLDTILGVK